MPVPAQWSTRARKFLPQRVLRSRMVISGPSPDVDGEYPELEVPERLARRNIIASISGTATVMLQGSQDGLVWHDLVQLIDGELLSYPNLLKRFLRLKVSNSSGNVTIRVEIEAVGGVA